MGHSPANFDNLNPISKDFQICQNITLKSVVLKRKKKKEKNSMQKKRKQLKFWCQLKSYQIKCIRISRGMAFAF